MYVFPLEGLYLVISPGIVIRLDCPLASAERLNSPPYLIADTVECSTIKSLPDLTFYFGGKPYTLTAEDYILQVQNQCLSAFTGIDIPGTPLWIIGDVFLRKFYTVYDKGRDAVGFAVSA
ncbi:MAG: hypothetical protein LBE44_01965 [Microbacterium hominis]|nr:hypothetical protein [Microbacterium hominis]